MNVLDNPKLTYYARIIDNSTGEQLLPFTDTKKYNKWYYGYCNSLEGGESQYMVEFDIWNNEPGWDGGLAKTTCKDIKNSYLKLILPKELTFPYFYLYARNSTLDYNKEFIAITGSDPIFDDVTGSNNELEKGTINGSGDHCIIQTKIKLKKHANLPNEQYSFELKFFYDYE